LAGAAAEGRDGPGGVTAGSAVDLSPASREVLGARAGASGAARRGFALDAVRVRRAVPLSLAARCRRSPGARPATVAGAALAEAPTAPGCRSRLRSVNALIAGDAGLRRRSTRAVAATSASAAALSRYTISSCTPPPRGSRPATADEALGTRRTARAGGVPARVVAEDCSSGNASHSGVGFTVLADADAVGAVAPATTTATRHTAAIARDIAMRTGRSPYRTEPT
jgi:hypothetical protein